MRCRRLSEPLLLVCLGTARLRGGPSVESAGQARDAKCHPRGCCFCLDAPPALRVSPPLCWFLPPLSRSRRGQQCRVIVFLLLLYILQDRVGLSEQAAAATGSRTAAEFLENVVKPMLNMEGDKLPVRWGVGVAQQAALLGAAC